MRTLAAAVMLYATGLTLVVAPTTLPRDGVIHDAFPVSTVITEPLRPAGGMAPSEQDGFWRTGEQVAPGTHLASNAAPVQPART